jgi:Amt family ammonium transporter
MTHWIKRLLAAGATALALGSVTMAVSSPAFAKDDAKPAVTAPATAAASAAPAAPAAPAPVANKGDTAWIMICTALVIVMTLPGLGLFYGGLVRSKNMLSVLMQCMVIFSLIAVLWAVYGYSIAFTPGNAFFGGFDRLFLAGLTPESMGATFSKGVVIPEFSFFSFQGAFATITC